VEPGRLFGGDLVETRGRREALTPGFELRPLAAWTLASISAVTWHVELLYESGGEVLFE
jgi:hypothetical protein